MITLRVIGEPAPQGSKARGRNGGLYEMSTKKLKPWRAAVRAAVLQHAAPVAGPVWPSGALTVEITFRLQRPAAHYGTGRNAGVLKDWAPEHPETRPDSDKLLRSTLDALKIAGIYGDDGQVTDPLVHKRYARHGRPTGAVISIRLTKADEEPEL